MIMRKAVGQGSGTRKYDLLTVLAVHALAQDKTMQRRALRLIALITARYNWQHDQLTVGQTEMARLWSVDVRTVKREMAAFRTLGWLIEQRPAARGRVAVYGLGIARIMEDTRREWGNVGPDLSERLGAPVRGGESENVIPFPAVALPAEETVWGQVARRLLQEDASVYRAWIGPLEPVEGAEELILHAPTGFHASYVLSRLSGRISRALAAVAPGMGLRIV